MSLCRDKSIPELGSTMTDCQTELSQLSSLVSSQVDFEEASHEDCANNAQHVLPCQEPTYDAYYPFHILLYVLMINQHELRPSVGQVLISFSCVLLLFIIVT